MRWLAEASCKGEDPSLWHPDFSTPESILIDETAKTICQSCPSRVECLDYAIDNEPYGTWGGMNELERDSLRMKRGLDPQMYWAERRNLSRALRRNLEQPA